MTHANAIYPPHTNEILAPPQYAHEVVPSDTEDLPHESRYIYVGRRGHLCVWLAGPHENEKYKRVTLRRLPRGTLIPLRVKRVWDEGTTAKDIVALW